MVYSVVRETDQEMLNKHILSDGYLERAKLKSTSSQLNAIHTSVPGSVPEQGYKDEQNADCALKTL